MKTRRLIILALLSAISILLHYVEGYMSLFIPIVGFRIGLSNIILIFALYYFDFLSYLFVLIIKVFLVALLSNGFSIQFFMSLSGSLLSLISILLLYFVIKPSIFATSATSALFHTIGQLLAYGIFFNSFYIFSYIIILGPLALVTGTIIALLSKILIKRLPNNFKQEEKIYR